MRRRCALPVLVMAPRRTRPPLEFSRETAPLYPMSCRGRAKRDSSPTSATRVAAPTVAIPRSACRAAITARMRSGAASTAVSSARSSRAMRSRAWSTSAK